MKEYRISELEKQVKSLIDIIATITIDVYSNPMFGVERGVEIVNKLKAVDNREIKEVDNENM